jgi:hypothetical protein
MSPDKYIPNHSEGIPFSPEPMNKKDLLRQDLTDVSKKIEKIRNKIEKQKEYASRLIPLKEIDSISQKDFQLQKNTLSMQRNALSIMKLEKIERKLKILEDKERDLLEIQEDLTQRIDAVTTDIQPPKSLFRKTLLSIIYPAVNLYSPERLQANNLIWPQRMAAEDKVLVYENENIVSCAFESEVKTQKAKRITFYTDDHHKLEGCIVYGNRKEHDLKQKKMMVMALGNAFTWQQGYLHAQIMAQKFDCNVLLYNPRGIGKSSGKTEYMQDAVVDCKAAISYALKKACSDEDSSVINPKNLGVYGHSLGGGISAIALQELVEEGKINKNGIGLYINHHSFSSLSSVVKGFGGQSFGGLSRLVLSMAKHNRLRAKKAIMETRLATRVVVVTGEQDKLMRKLARLNEALLKAESKGRPIANQVMYISIPDYGHHEEEEYLRDYDQMVEESQTENDEEKEEKTQSSEGELNAEKLIQLQNYHDAIEEWARS